MTDKFLEFFGPMFPDEEDVIYEPTPKIVFFLVGVDESILKI